MRKSVLGVITAIAAAGSVLAAVPAQAQMGDRDRDGVPDRREWSRDRDRDGVPDRREWNRDRDRDGRPDQYDRHDNRRDRVHYWGGRHGYSGYKGRWRSGQRYPYYNNRRYWIDDYRRYGLERPWRGYRYYRTDSGEIVMAAIATGLIGLIISGALDDNDGYRRRY